MCPRFSDDDAGKTVKNASGKKVGIVSAVEGDSLHVKPDPGIADSIKAKLGWQTTSGETATISEHSIDHITDDAIHLSGDLDEGSPTRSEGAFDDTGPTGTGSDTHDSSLGDDSPTDRYEDEGGLGSSDTGRTGVGTDERHGDDDDSLIGDEDDSLIGDDDDSLIGDDDDSLVGDDDDSLIGDDESSRGSDDSLIGDDDDSRFGDDDDSLIGDDDDSLIGDDDDSLVGDDDDSLIGDDDDSRRSDDDDDRIGSS